METARSAFHAQLAAVMDSLLAAAVCEIAKIFESSLCEQQAELTQKMEEILDLRLRLDNAEKRHRSKAGESEERVQSPTGGIVEKVEPAKSLSRNLRQLKKEDTDQDEANIKDELELVQPPDESLTAETQPTADAIPATDGTNKILNWTQGSCKVDPDPLEISASAQFLSVVTGIQAEDWTPGKGRSKGSGTAEERSRRAESGRSALSLSNISDRQKESYCEDIGVFPFPGQDMKDQRCENLEQNHSDGGIQTFHQLPSSDSLWQNRSDGTATSHSDRSMQAAGFSCRNSEFSHSNTQSLPHSPSTGCSAPGGRNTRPYACPYCTKCFTYPSHQRRHLLRHTGLRLHPCQLCDKSFHTSSELTVHIRTHTGERPFTCIQCGKRFARSGNLRAHQRDVHMRKRPFACRECGKRFAHRGNLRMHNHRVHQIDAYYMES